MNENKNQQQIVSPEQFTQLMTQATGGIPLGQPAQQLFQTPAPQAQMQQSPQFVVPPQAPQAPIAPNPTLTAPIQPQVAQVGAPGSVRQEEYEKMREDTNKFLHGMIDASMPYIAKEAVKHMTEEERQEVAKKAIENEVKKAGFFGSTFGHFMLGITGALVGYGIGAYVFGAFDDKKENNEEEVAALLDATRTVLS